MSESFQFDLMLKQTAIKAHDDFGKERKGELRGKYIMTGREKVRGIEIKEVLNGLKLGTQIGRRATVSLRVRFSSALFGG